MSFSVSSSMFYFICRLIQRRSLISMQFLFARSYFLNIAAISFLFSFKYGLQPIAFMNSLKLIPPASSRSNSAMISQTVFLLGLNPFWESKSVRSLGSKTPMPVESYVSKTSFRSITSSIFNWPVTQSWGSKCSRSFLLNLTLYISWFRSARPSLFSGVNPNFYCFFLSGVRVLANDRVLAFSFWLIMNKSNTKIKNKDFRDTVPLYDKVVIKQLQKISDNLTSMYISAFNFLEFVRHLSKLPLVHNSKFRIFFLYILSQLLFDFQLSCQTFHGL